MIYMSSLRERARHHGWGWDEREAGAKRGHCPSISKDRFEAASMREEIEAKTWPGMFKWLQHLPLHFHLTNVKTGRGVQVSQKPASAYWNNIFTTLAHTLRHSFTFNWELGFRVLKCCSTLYAWTQNLGYSVQNVVRRWWTVWYLETESTMRWWKEQLHSFCESSYSDDSWNQFRHLGQLVKLI